MKTYYPGNLGGNDRRFNRNQNSYDNKQPGMYRRNGMQQQRGKRPDAETAMTEGITAVKDSLREIIGFQQRLADSQDRIAQAQEAHAQAMQQIAACVRHFLGKGPDAEQPEISPIEETISPVVEEPAPEAEQDASAAAPEAEGEGEPVLEPAQDESEPMPELASEETETCDASSEPALKIIAGMRENGCSYEKIAEHLETQGIPHASGNGRWNRWTVSKLYKEAFL
jgi:hypothetical protein